MFVRVYRVNCFRNEDSFALAHALWFNYKHHFVVLFVLIHYVVLQLVKLIR
jgi:hypothetical protein